MKSKVTEVREVVKNTPIHEYATYQVVGKKFVLTNPVAISVRTQETGSNLGFDSYKEIERWIDKSYKGLPTVRKVVQRNLPLNRKYTLIDARYAGTENYQTCENCNKPITNIAHVRDDKGNDFMVGLDCAATLTGISENPFELKQHEDLLKSFVSLRAKLLKKIKQGRKIKISIINSKRSESDVYFIRSVDGAYWESIDVEYGKKYFLPMIQDIVRDGNIIIDQSAANDYYTITAQTTAEKLSKIL